MSPTNEYVLTGIRVLDFTRNLAGPSCTRLLVEMGAEIIKVESAPHGERTRRNLEGVDRSLFFVQQNRGKKSVCVNLRDPRGVALIEGMARQVDVVVENFRPGVMRDIGLGYERLVEIRPDTILCSISALGQTGPLAQKPGYDYIAQAYAGVTSMTGEPGEAPYIPAVGLGDVSTGAHAALAILAALRHRDRTGEGQHLDVSLLDVYYHFHETNVSSYSASGGELRPTRNGRHMTYLCPAGVFRANGGDLVIMAHGHHWKDLCRAMERPDLVRDPRFKNDHARLAIQTEVVDLIETWLRRFPDSESALAQLELHDVPVGPVLSVAETVSHPHLRGRGTVRTIHDSIHGDFDVPGMPLKFSAFPGVLSLEAPSLGQDNAEVLSELLGVEADELETLLDEGVLVKRKV